MYRFLLISILSLFSVFCIQAQTKNVDKPAITDKKTKSDTTKISIPILNNVRLDFDLSPVITSVISSSEIYSFESAVQVTLLNKYYPIFELGYASVNHISNSDIGFKTNGLFGRIGMDFNLIKQKKGKKFNPNLILAGLRLGYSNSKYDMTNNVVKSDYWKEEIKYDILNVSANKLWYEIVFGIRVEIAKNIYMGWTIRNKRPLKEFMTGELNPWYTPGFGKNTGTNIGLNYMIGYKF